MVHAMDRPGRPHFKAHRQPVYLRLQRNSGRPEAPGHEIFFRVQVADLALSQQGQFRQGLGRSHESILHLRKTKQFGLNIDAVRVPYGEHTLKYPVHPQADSSLYSNGKKASSVWVPNPLGAKPKDVFEIPTTCNGMGEKTKHPTQKPEELLRKLVLAASSVGDVVLDPFSGSGTTAVVAEQLQRVWLGCDLSAEYNSWAIDRIDHVIPRTIDQWTAFDRENAKRRESIR